jgi:purine nucleoside permease
MPRKSQRIALIHKPRPCAGEFQHWYERYWMDSAPIEIRGALNPACCNPDGVCGAVLGMGMGKVASSSSISPNADHWSGHVI